jgi:hypothetical protein
MRLLASSIMLIKYSPWAAAFQPIVLAGVPLHQFAEAAAPWTPGMHFVDALRLCSPQLGCHHPAAHRFAAHMHVVALGQVFGRQRRSKSAIHVLAQDLDGFALHLAGNLSVRSAPSPGMRYRPVAALFERP